MKENKYTNIIITYKNYVHKLKQELSQEQCKTEFITMCIDETML